MAPPRDVGTTCLSRPFRLAGRRVTALILASDQVTQLIREPGQRGSQQLTTGPSRAPDPQVLQKARTPWWRLVSNSRGGQVPCWATGFNDMPLMAPGIGSSAPDPHWPTRCQAPPALRHGHGDKGLFLSVLGDGREALGGFPQQSAEREDQSN